MPLVDIKCPKCGEFETYFTLDEAGKIRLGDPCKCPQCGDDAERIHKPSVNPLTGELERLSRALAIPAEMVKSGVADQIHPGATWRPTKGGMMAMVIKSRSEKLRRIKERSNYTNIEYFEGD